MEAEQILFDESAFSEYDNHKHFIFLFLYGIQPYLIHSTAFADLETSNAKLNKKRAEEDSGKAKGRSFSRKQED